jgi:aspartyl-tRNA(Asn)/glutamyl-tRNA(Gln) amidotransferase subunit A
MLFFDELPMSLAIPRIEGRVLNRLSRLVRHEPFRSLSRRQLAETYRLDELFGLPPEARDGFDESPRPVAGRPPRDWGHTDYDPPTSDRTGATAADLREAYRSGETTPIEVLEQIRSIVEDAAFGESVHDPHVCFDWEEARRAAEASTARYRDDTPLGPVDGIPVPIKDHHHMQGLLTQSGTSYMGEFEGPAEVDSEPVRRLRNAGALLYGKTHTTEWGMQPTGFNPHFEMPRNVYDRERAAGGSSTGTATAVGLGLAPTGLGSDGGGSIRIPAACNGLFGLKPSFQRLSRRGDAWKFSTLSHNGPIGRSTRDLVDFLIPSGAEPDPDDPATTHSPDAGEAASNWRRALGRGIDGARIGIWRWAFEMADDAIASACRSTLDALEREGAELVEVDVRYADFHQSIGALTIGVESLGFLHEVFEHFEEECSDDLRLMWQTLSTIEASEYMRARRTRAVLRRTLAETFENVDLIAAPTTNMPPPRYDLDDDGVAIYDEKATMELCRFAFLANLTGVPAGTVPIAMRQGLPIGLQLIGDAWDEASVLAAMAHCERAGLTSLPEPPTTHALV